MKPYLICTPTWNKGKVRSDYRRAVSLYYRTCKEHPLSLVRFFSIEPNGYARLIMQQDAIQMDIPPGAPMA